MDDMDRLLRALPSDEPSPGFAAAIAESVRRRHRRRRTVRRSVAAFLCALGLWLIWPAILWLSSGELYASGAQWLLGGLNSLNAESTEIMVHTWNSVLSAQDALGASVGVSTWLGALLLCSAIFLALDSAPWQPLPTPRRPDPNPSGLSPSLHTGFTTR